MGLTASIFKDKRIGPCSNGGISERFDEVTIVNVPGPSIPTDERPSVALLAGNVAGTVKMVPVEVQRECVKCGAQGDGRAEPICSNGGLVGGHSYADTWVVAAPAHSVGPMMGGCYIATSDSRFTEAVEKITGSKFYGAVPLHDRFEVSFQVYAEAV